MTQAQGVPLELLQLQSGESISDLYSFLGETEGVAAQNAFLGYQAFIFDPAEPNDPNNTQYLSNIAPGDFNHEYAYLTRGETGKYTLNFATQFTEDFYFGINLNSHIIDYDRFTHLSESNTNVGSTVNHVVFENNLSVLGSGFSAQLGAIAKLSENIRVGLSLDSPTWYVISEETTQYLESTREENSQSITEVVDPRVLNVFEDYELRTPGKITAGIAYIFGKTGLLSFDYSHKDYSQIQFSPKNDPYFASQNDLIENTLKGASSYRLGGEYRIDRLSLRGGLRYEESPYENEITVGDLKGFSLGLGYNFGNYSFDLSYARAEQSRNQQLYATGLTDTAAVDTVYNTFVFTLGFDL